MATQSPNPMPNAPVYHIARAVLGATWLIACASFFPPLRATALGGFGRMVFVALSTVHLVECIAFLSVLRRSGRPLAEELWQTFLFGIVHVTAVRRELESRDGGAH